MPKCKKCLIPFQQTIMINNKERTIANRIHCFEYVPFNSQRNNKIISDDEDKNCQCCGKLYRKFEGSNHSLKYCNACKSSSRRIHLKIKAVEYLGGKCGRCGYNECIEALVFHHRNPSEKSFTISSNYNKAWTKIQSELDKCDLLCSNCHCFIHYNEMITKSLIHESLDEKRRKQKEKLISEHKEKINAIKDKTQYAFCLCCNKEFIYKYKDHKYCSPECSKRVRRKVERPSKEVLEEEIKTSSMVSLGKKYGVSDNAVKKWCKSYGIYNRRGRAATIPVILDEA